MSPWIVFFLIYFGLYAPMMWQSQIMDVICFLFQLMIPRVTIAAVFSFLFYLGQPAEPEPEFRVEMSDIMIDDMKDRLEPAFILPTK